jgi:hypothetical protein
LARLLVQNVSRKRRARARSDSQLVGERVNLLLHVAAGPHRARAQEVVLETLDVPRQRGRLLEQPRDVRRGLLKTGNLAQLGAQSLDGGRRLQRTSALRLPHTRPSLTRSAAPVAAASLSSSFLTLRSSAGTSVCRSASSVACLGTRPWNSASCAFQSWSSRALSSSELGVVLRICASICDAVVSAGPSGNHARAYPGGDAGQLLVADAAVASEARVPRLRRGLDTLEELGRMAGAADHSTGADRRR